MSAELTDADVRAMVVAHAIHLGKCPPAGMVVSFNAQVERLYTATLDTAALTEKRRYQFTVTEQDLANARALVADANWTHATAAKVTIMPL